MISRQKFALVQRYPRWTSNAAHLRAKIRRGNRPRRLARRGLIWGFAGLCFLAAGAYEIHASTFQAWLFSSYASTVSFKVEPGPSSAIAFPKTGPFDARRGYTQLANILDRLISRGYTITEQSRVSPQLARLIEWGIHPPYDQITATGLRIRDRDGHPIYDALSRRELFQNFNQIPPVIINALLLIENRELALTAVSTANPAIEWDRLGKAGLLYTAQRIGYRSP